MSTESGEHITREQVIAAYQPFVEKSCGNPFRIDRDDPEAKAAVTLEIKWMSWTDLEVRDDHEKFHRHNHAKTMLWVDAGFTELNYLYEVRGWLDQDIDNAEEIPGNDARTETRRIILEGIERVGRLIEAAEAKDGSGQQCE